MKAYMVTWTKSPKSRRFYTWIRYAETLEAAAESATRAIDEETFGEGILINVIAAPVIGDAVTVKGKTYVIETIHTADSTQAEHPHYAQSMRDRGLIASGSCRLASGRKVHGIDWWKSGSVTLFDV